MSPIPASIRIKLTVKQHVLRYMNRFADVMELLIATSVLPAYRESLHGLRERVRINYFKRSLWSLWSLLILLTLIACRVDEPSGKSDFFIYNLSSADLIFKGDYQGGILQVNAPINEKTPIGRFYGDIGQHAFPSEIFNSIRIYLTADPDSPVYEQTPVVDSLWIHKTPRGFEWWEYAHYSLIITDSDL